MYKIKCPVCKGTHTVKNGKRQGVQLYVCKECGYQFRNGKIVDIDEKLMLRFHNDFELKRHK